MPDVNKVLGPDTPESNKPKDGKVTISFKLDADRASKLYDIALKYECFAVHDVFSILIDKEQV
ncbi:hypothetical protein LCGC14_1340460 [marine sediment metagenome]|uniref:Uncharacterized protein n=1 Tax=marine sediment metagenome TaxID=412755 RepID=A0A0F9L098_9ZZZZ